MKRIIIFSACIAALSMLFSCTEELKVSGPSISISVVSSSIDTKATKPGDNDFRENKITSVHWFVYPSGQTGSNAVMSGKETGLNATSQSDLSIPVDENQVNNLLFPRGGSGKCVVYTIVNLPSGITIPSNTSIENLKNTIYLESDFLTYTKTGTSVFVMDGQAEITLASRTANIVATGTIPVDRVASKTTVSVVPAAQAEDATGNIWVPQPEQMWIKVYNSVKNSYLSADFDDNTNPIYFSYPANPKADTPRGFHADGTGTYTSDPFYSYPMKWDFNTPEEPYIVIMLPWKKVGEERYVPYYYKVLFNGKEAVRNTWYHLVINLSVLGSLEEDNPPVETQDVQYYVCGWNNEIFDIKNSVDAEFRTMRYLVVPETEFILDNINGIDIEFFSSHDCEIASVTCSRPNLIKAWNGGTDNLDTQAKNWFSIVTVGENSYIRFNHVLNNDRSGTDYDYTEYDFTLRIRHKDKPNDYYEDLVITQYPALSSKVSVNSNWSGRGTNYVAFPNAGYVFVNGGYRNSGNNVSNGYGGVSDVTGGYPSLTGTNVNPSMYVIRTTALPEDSPYIIGDPRKKEVDNLGTWISTQQNGVAIENPSTSRKLMNYHPTETSDEYQWVIAPEFRYASSLGKTSAQSYASAQQRCASYQEDGRPAGRWRVPTRAEAEYVIRLSLDGKIPSLFTPETKPARMTGMSLYQYWCGNGVISPWNDGTTSFFTFEENTTAFSGTYGGQHSVRCVYDEWYWKNSDYPLAADKTKFTWGDEN